MKILTIIVTYNGSKWIDTCFSSLKHSTIPLDVLVVDNGSTDNTVALIKTKFPEVEIVEPGENLGFAKANNIGLNRVLEKDYDFAFLLNQDAWIEPDAVEKLINIATNNSGFGIISPLHFNGEGDLLDFKFHEYINRADGEGRKLCSDLLLNRSLNPVYSVSFINAAAWLLTRDCIKKVGFLDDELFIHYGEDVNYSYRVLYHKYKIGVVPNAVIYHDREPRKGQFAATSIRQDHTRRRFKMEYSNILLNDVEVNKRMNKILSRRKSVLKSNLKRLRFSAYKKGKTEIEVLQTDIALIQSRRKFHKQPFSR